MLRCVLFLHEHRLHGGHRLRRHPSFVGRGDRGSTSTTTVGIGVGVGVGVGVGGHSGGRGFSGGEKRGTAPGKFVAVAGCGTTVMVPPVHRWLLWPWVTCLELLLMLLLLMLLLMQLRVRVR